MGSARGQKISMESAALAGYLVGLFYEHTPLSLGVTVAAFACLTLLVSGFII